MNEQKDTIQRSIKPLWAGVGLLLAVILIAWLTVSIVRVAPTTFSSLASLASSVLEYRDTLGENVDGPITIATQSIETVSNEPVTLEWEKDTRPGTYSFSFSCTDGVQVAVVETDGLRDVTCDTAYAIGDTTSLTIIPEAEQDVTLAYQISFKRDIDESPIRTGSGTVAITRPENGLVLGEQDSEDWQDTIEEIATSSVATSTTTRPTTPVYTVVWPTSDPAGFIDLTPVFRNSGSISNNTFTPGTIRQNNTGAIQFEVQNLGTKTSGRWTYAVALPDGNQYVSPPQAALQPTERVFISIGFPTASRNSHTFSVVLAGAEDRNPANNSFTQTIRFVP